MRSTRPLRRWIAALAGWALLATSLLPWLVHARGAASAGDWVEICTAQGSRWVRADASTPDDAGVPAGTGHHHPCALCAMGADAADLPPAAHTIGITSTPREPATFRTPWLRAAEPRVRPQPRGPPSLA